MELRRQAFAIAAAVAIAAIVGACTSPGEAVTAPPTPFASPFFGAPPARARTPEIRDLAGLEPADVLSILGQPDLKRDEPPAELWQYRAPDCVLNLFFYDQAGSYRLAHAEAWQRALAGGSAPARCHDEAAPIKAHLVSRSSL
jgi:hypothetical protein